MLRAEHRTNATSRRLETVPGVGPLLASAITATVADARCFKSGRHFAAWLGRTPRIHGTGGKVTLGPITKQGDRYLRRLLVLGATAVLGRLAFKQVATALANKIARIVWALLVRGGTYVAGHRPAIGATPA